MGLLLSVLVFCVGAAELLALCANVRRRIEVVSVADGPDLGSVTRDYVVDGLARERNRLISEIERLQKQQEQRAAVEYPDRNRSSDADVGHVAQQSGALNDGNVVLLHDLEDEFREQQHRAVRESSPFPTYERLAPRGSICTELVKDPVIRVDECEEEATESHFDSRDFWSRSRSKTPEILRDNLLEFDRKTKARSKSPFERVVGAQDVETVEPEVLDSLDGLSPEKRPTKKRPSGKKNGPQVADIASTSKCEDVGEPFWVKPKK